MPDEHEEGRSLLPQTPGAKRTIRDDLDDLVPPSHFEQRLSTDSKLSNHTDSAKQANHDTLRRLSASSLSYYGRAISPGPDYQHPRWQESHSQSWTARAKVALKQAWTRNKGVILVAVSQLFGALMNLSARLLEHEADMNPFQVLFARQSLTMLCSVLYMWRMKTPDWPLGPREVRWLLIARGFTGFFGIWGMWSSMRYLGLAEATVITFLAPSVAGFACYVSFGEPFTRPEQLGTLVAFVGVIFIAHPTSLWSGPSTVGPPEGGSGYNETMSAAATAVASAASSAATAAAEGGAGADSGAVSEVTSAERLWALGMALVGVLGAAGAFTTIRWIGKRAHPLISVNYFAAWCTLVTTVLLTLGPALDINQPEMRFLLPQGARQWFLLLFLGAMGFIMQFILTAGLSADRSNRANAMIFTHMLFAAAFDKLVFGQSMGWMSLVGCGLIIGGALYMVLSKPSGPPKKSEGDVEAGVAAVTVRDTETVPMLLEVDRDDDEEEQELDRRRTPLGG